MTAFLLLVSCLALGIAVARYAQPPLGLAQGLNWWVIQIALPALVLDLVPRLSLDPQLWFLIASQWLVFGGAWLLFATLGGRLGWSRARIGALILVCGLGNTSFMGYPLIEALRGRDGLSLAVVADQLGCFPLLAVGGVMVTSIYSGAVAAPREVARRVLLFPAFLALLAGAAAGALGGWPAPLETVFSRLGATLTPLALFSVGLRFRLQFADRQAVPLALGLGWKLLAAPLAVYGLAVLTGIDGAVMSIGVLQAAMAPMISAAILADQHRLEPQLANTVLGAGILLSLLSVPVWNAFLP